jgi:hypothetical protein
MHCDTSLSYTSLRSFVGKHPFSRSMPWFEASGLANLYVDLRARINGNGLISMIDLPLFEKTNRHLM